MDPILYKKLDWEVTNGLDTLHHEAFQVRFRFAPAFVWGDLVPFAHTGMRTSYMPHTINTRKPTHCAGRGL